MDPSDRKRLEDYAGRIRALTIEEIGHLGIGHMGGAMSIVELLATLYGSRMRQDSAKPLDPDRDRLVLSKGHAGPALYATLATKGYFPLDWLLTLNQGGTRLPSHCDRSKTPGIDMTTGSLGQGLSAAAGMAVGLRMEGRPSTVYAIVGDGECDEGQNWEAAMFAAHQGLDNLVAFMDNNGMQIDGRTVEILSLGDPVAKWRAFGWEAERVDGHDVAAIDAAIGRALARRAAGPSSGAPARPTMIVLDTVKGKGCAFCEDQVTSHNCAVSAEQLAEALAKLGRSPELKPAAAGAR